MPADQQPHRAGRALRAELALRFAPRPPYRWMWWLLGIALLCIFWQPLLVIALLGALTGHPH